MHSEVNHAVERYVVFGNRNLDEITKADVERYIEQRKEDLIKKRNGRGRVADREHFAIVNREVAYLNRLFKWAIERNHAKNNPCDGIQRLNERERIRFLRDEKDEEARLLEACSGRIRDVVRFALHTGLRRNEIATLSWDCVDLRRGFVTVLPENAKNGERRTIGLNVITVEVLTRLKGEEGKPKGHVFLNRVGKPYQPGAISNQFMKAVKKAGLNDLRFHDLRHTFACRLAMRGVPLLDIARLMGHKTLQMVMRYSHFTDQHLKTHVELLTQPARTPKMQYMDTIWTPEPFSGQIEVSKTNDKPLN
jgi:integrase